MDRADRHLREDEVSAIDSSYEEDLENLLQEAEELLDKFDVKGDEVEATREKQRQISRCLPRTQPQKWDGTIHLNNWNGLWIGVVVDVQYGHFGAVDGRLFLNQLLARVF